MTRATTGVHFAKGPKGPSMKIVIAVALAVLLSGCGLIGNDQAQILALQQQVNALSQQVHALKQSSTTAESLDLQSKCAIDAKRTFELLGYSYNKTSNGAVVFFASHFDPRRAQCFMLLTQNNLSQQYLSEDVFDANTQIGYGSMVMVKDKVMVCEMDSKGTVQMRGSGGKLCLSEQQFDQYAARYMGTVAN